MHLVFAVSDVDRAVDFYEKAFGWTPHLAWPQTYSELLLPDGDALGLFRRDRFALTAGADPVEVPAGRHSAAYLYVRVDDLDTAVDRLDAAGAKALSPRSEREWGDEAAWFADPDGNLLAVGRRLPA